MLGRFQQADPYKASGSSVRPQSWNRYGYVANNPVNFVDTLGHFRLRVPPAIPNPSVIDWSQDTGLLIDGWTGQPFPGSDPDVDKPPCPEGPKAPPGASVDENIKAVEQMRKMLRSEGRQTDFFSLWLWLFSQVKNKGAWDYKQQGRQYQDFGNFNYGAVASSAGFDETTILRLAGWAQQQAGTSKPEWGNPGGGPAAISSGIRGQGTPPYGDDPADQAQIKAGINYETDKALGRCK